MIELKQVNKFYKGKATKVHALKDVAIQFDPGDRVLVKGPSGAGKSTLLNIIGLLDSSYQGSYLFQDKNISNQSKRKNRKLRNNHFAYIFQEYELIEKESVFDNLTLPLVYQK